MREGRCDLDAGWYISALAGFPEWHGAKLLCAQAEGMYWFLVMRSDLGAGRGDVDAVRGRRIGAAPWVEMGLRRLLIEAGGRPAGGRGHVAPRPGALAGGAEFRGAAPHGPADGQSHRVAGD